MLEHEPIRSTLKKERTRRASRMISIDQSISPFPVHGHESIDSDGKRKGEKGRGRFEKGREGFAEDIEEDIRRRPVWP